MGTCQIYRHLALGLLQSTKFWLLFRVCDYIPHHQVGVLMHETELTYDKTQQVARERQRVELSSEGLYDIQVLSLSLNTAELDLDNPPTFVVEWGGRESDMFTFQELHEDTGEELATTMFLDRGS